jgi:hypothetical protein
MRLTTLLEVQMTLAIHLLNTVDAACDQRALSTSPVDLDVPTHLP